jgi:hypothetical protein
MSVRPAQVSTGTTVTSWSRPDGNRATDDGGGADQDRDQPCDVGVEDADPDTGEEVDLAEVHDHTPVPDGGLGQRRTEPFHGSQVDLTGHEQTHRLNGVIKSVVGVHPVLRGNPAGG